MTDTLKVPTNFYLQPVRTAENGVMADFRSVEFEDGDQITTQIMAMAVLPAGHRLVDCAVECEDMDSATAHVFNLGILNTYYNEGAASVAKPAAYNSGGVTNTGTAPALVTGQNIFTGLTTAQAGGRFGAAVLGFSTAIGVDYERDRIIALQFSAVGTAVDAKDIAVIPTYVRA